MEAATASTSTPGRSAARPLGRIRALAAGALTGGGLLSVGTLASGVLAYVFNVAAARALGATAYGPVALLWAGMFLVSVVLFRPIEQTLSQGIASRLARGEDARPMLRSVGRLTVMLAGAATVAILAAWSPLTDRLFDGRAALTVALAAAVVGYAASYYVRGVLSGMQRFGSYGALLLADGAVRVVVLLPLVFVASPAVAAVAIVAAAWGGAFAPRLAPRTDPGAAPLTRAAIGAELAGKAAPAQPLLRSLSFAGPIAIIAAAEQILVSGGALLVAMTDADATAAAGTVFAATMLVRAPVFLFQGVAAFLLPTLTGFHERGEHSRFVRRIGLMSALMTAVGAVLVAGSLVAGPWAMKTLFGPTFIVGVGDLTILSAGVAAYLVAATLSQGSLARGAAPAAAAIWAAAAVAFVTLELTLGGAPFHRVSVAFTAATALAALAFLPVVARGGQRR